MAGGIRPRRRGLVVLSSAAGLLAVGWLATEPWLADHWPQLLVAVLFLLVLPVPRWSTPGRGDEDRPQLHHDGRIGLVQALAGVAVIARRAVLAGDPAPDLSGALLPGARLAWARLAGADLSGADLRGTSLQNADLSGARMEQSLLCGAQLQGADLRGARLSGARLVRFCLT